MQQHPAILWGVPDPQRQILPQQRIYFFAKDGCLPLLVPLAPLHGVYFSLIRLGATRGGGLAGFVQVFPKNLHIDKLLIILHYRSYRLQTELQVFLSREPLGE